MSDGNGWSTEFYAATNGRVPVAEFLDGLDAKTRARFRWSMEQLRLRNVQAREPLVKKLDDDPWELREESGTNIYRMTPRHIIGDAGVYLRWQHNWPVRAAGLAPESRFALARGVIFLPR